MDNRDAAKILRGLVTIDRLRLLRPEIAAINQAADALDIAPALLAALERIVAAESRMPGNNPIAGLCDDARTAIAAARGEG